MDYFEEAEKEITQEQAGTDEVGLPKGAVTADQTDDIFWKGAKKPLAEKKKHKGLKVFLTVSAMLLLVFAGVGISMISLRGNGWLGNLIRGEQRVNFTLPVAERPELDGEYVREDGRYTVEGVAKAAADSVVYIEVYSSSKSLLSKGQGSGIIMSDKGYIVTNAHVVEDSDSGIKVVTNDGLEYSAVLIGADQTTDIAVLKINAQGLKPAEFGSSADVKQGEEIVTIGSPAGYNNSVTAGVVSSVNRKVRSKDGTDYIDCIQIDAAINPGNSGGGLFNMWGQVIGITSSKLSSNDYEGIGFAVTTDELKPIIEDLIEKGYVSGRARIGLTYYLITETTAEINNTPAGAYVVDIDESCDAANSGLEEGDIITSIDGKDPLKYEKVSDIFADKKPGDTLTCEVIRLGTDGEYETLTVSFKLMEDNGGFVEN
ncbi:MAG: trypsin-like peptidase domain-containing protein [Ruminococcus sp.]|nr:trypsin-like peptidase domain-containing protein [Ruminococcus sp.]